MKLVTEIRHLNLLTLIDEAGGIDFNHPAYTMTRTQINGFIRYAENINLIECLVFFIRTRNHRLESKFDEKRDAAKKGLNKDQIKMLDDSLSSVTNDAVIMMLKNSPFFTLIIALVVFLYVPFAEEDTGMVEIVSSEVKYMYSDNIYTEGVFGRKISTIHTC